MKDSVIYGIAASLVVVGIGLTVSFSPSSSSTVPGSAAGSGPPVSDAEVKPIPDLGQNMVEVSAPTEAVAAKQPQLPQRPPLPTAIVSDSANSGPRASAPAEVAPIDTSRDPDGVSHDDPVAVDDAPYNPDSGQNRTPL